MIKTAIVILHYENKKMTDQCVNSILETTKDGTYHIVVVDNNSPTKYYRADRNSRVSIIRNDSHYSVSGMNFGFYHSLYRLPWQVEYIVNFDSDIICQQNWLEPLISCMEASGNIGIVGGKQWDLEKKFYRSVGADLMGMIYYNYPTCRKSVYWIQGSFVMMRAEMMKRIGLHDTRYKIICSDSDYCLHAIDRGYIVVFEPESNVIHIGNASYGGKPVESELEDKKNFLQKWAGLKFSALIGKFPITQTVDECVYGKVTMETFKGEKPKL